VVSAKEHMQNGGLGNSIAQLLARKLPSPMGMVVIDDEFGESGKSDELMSKFKLDTKDIVEASLKAIERKQQ